MTKEQFAEMLDGREVGDEMTDSESALAKQFGLLIAFGASDDLIELRGVVIDEVNAYDGGEAYVTKAGKLVEPLEDESDIEVLEKYGVLDIVQKAHLGAIKIVGAWCEEEPYSWTFTTEEPHATFDILEEGEKFCRGIVLQLELTPD